MSIEQLNNFITELSSLKAGQYIVQNVAVDGTISFSSSDKKQSGMGTREIVRLARDAFNTFQTEAKGKNANANATSLDALCSGLENYYIRVGESIRKRWWYSIAARFGYSKGPKEIREMLAERPLTLAARKNFIAKLEESFKSKEYLVRTLNGDFALQKQKPTFFKTKQILAVSKMCFEMKSAHAKAADSDHTTLMQRLRNTLNSYITKRNDCVGKKWGVWFASWFSNVNASIQKDLHDVLSVADQQPTTIQEQEHKNFRSSEDASKKPQPQPLAGKRKTALEFDAQAIEQEQKVLKANVAYSSDNFDKKRIWLVKMQTKGELAELLFQYIDNSSRYGKYLESRNEQVMTAGEIYADKRNPDSYIISFRLGAKSDAEASVTNLIYASVTKADMDRYAAKLGLNSIV